MKKKLLLIPFTIIASVALFGPMASAAMVTMDWGMRSYGNGGEFNASSQDFAPATMGYVAQTMSGNSFETFCVEENEFFTPGHSYYYQISQATFNGGVGGGHPDPLSRGTAWLYLQFATHNLTGYDYDTMGNSNFSAKDLQEAIWFLEGEVTGQENNQFVLLARNTLGVNDYLLDNNGYYGVGVLNLWVNSDYTGLAQDQLILEVPDGGSTVMLLGLGFLGLFVGRWKLNRRNHAA